MTRDRWPASPLDQSGLTLVEILLALGVIGIAVAALGIIVPLSSYGIQHANQVSTATFLAEQMIERARAATWTADPAVDCLGVSAGDSAPSLTEASCPGRGATIFPDEIDGVGGYPQYRRIVRVTSCATTPCAGVGTAAMRMVEVTVAYAPPAGSLSSGPDAVRLAWLVSQK